MAVADPPLPLPRGDIKREDIPAAGPKHKQRAPSLPLLLAGELHPLHARVVEGEVAALRLRERAGLHRRDVRELRLQVAARGVPYLDAAVAGGEGEEVGGGAEGGEEVADGG